MNPLSLTFLGSGDAFSSGGRLQSGIFIDSQAGGLLLDCGSTLLTGLNRAGLNTDQIDSVAISHLHGDHFGGIPFLLLDALFVRKRQKSLEIIGPIGTEERVLKTCNALYPGALDGPFPFAINYSVLDRSRPIKTDQFIISATEVNHGGSSDALALRVEVDERTIAYSGDTCWTDNLITLAEGSQLFICECCNFADPSPAHLDYKTLEKHLAELDSERIILTHTGPQIDLNRQHIKLEIAHDGLKLEL